LTTEEFDYNTNTWTSMGAPLEQVSLGVSNHKPHFEENCFFYKEKVAIMKK
jgi:hypothetical protein